MTEDYKTPVAAPPDWRGLCEELLRELENCIAVHYGVGGTHHISAADAVIARVRAALAAEPVAEVPTYDDLSELCSEHGLDVDSWPLEKFEALWEVARAVLARWGRPAPVPVEGEVAELAEFLRVYGDEVMDEYGDVGEHDMLTRAAELLEQRHPTPVPVSERLPGPEDCTANPRNGEGEWCWGWRQDSSNSPFSGRWRMVPRAFMVEEATHWLPFNALPLPQGEVEP